MVNLAYVTPDSFVNTRNFKMLSFQKPMKTFAMSLEEFSFGSYILIWYGIGDLGE